MYLESPLLLQKTKILLQFGWYNLPLGLLVLVFYTGILRKSVGMFIIMATYFRIRQLHHYFLIFPQPSPSSDNQDLRVIVLEYWARWFQPNLELTSLFVSFMWFFLLALVSHIIAYACLCLEQKLAPSFIEPVSRISHCSLINTVHMVVSSFY